jgi:CysZ protein
MNSVVSALVEAFKTLLHPKMLALMIWPMLVAVVVWVLAAMSFWDSWVTSVTGMVQATPLEQWMAHGFLAVASHYLIVTILLLLLFPAIYVTALLITSTFAMSMMVNHIAEKSYPELERRHGGSNAGSIVNAGVAILVYGAGWVLSLPLWLFTPLAMILPLLLMAWLNQHLFRYDALAEHASGEEFTRVIAQARGRLVLLGIVLGLLQFVPLLNLFSPVYVALAFIHLCLAELKRLRQAV